MAIQWQSWMRWAWPGLWNPQIGQQMPGPISSSNEARQEVTESRAMQVGAVFRCIRIISEVSAALPMHAYSGTPGGDRVLLPDSHWLQSLVEEPNEVMTGDEYRETQFAQMAGWGNGYSRRVSNAQGRDAELWPLVPGKMIVRRQEDRTVTYQYPKPTGTPEPLTSDDVLHLRAFTVDGYMGLSPLGLARETLGITIGADRYAASFFAQGGRPAHILTSDKTLNDAQRAQVRREYGGIGDVGSDDQSKVEYQTGKRMWVLEASLKYQPVTVSPEDMQMLETRQFQVSDVARFFGVPLFLLMETSKDTTWGSGLEQMNLGFLTYTLRPYLQRMCTIWNRRIVPLNQRGKIFVDIDTSPLLTMDSNALKEVYASYTMNGIMTRNEARRILKLPQSTMKNADALTAQIALTTIDKLGTTAAPPPGTAQQPATVVKESEWSFRDAWN